MLNNYKLPYDDNSAEVITCDSAVSEFPVCDHPEPHPPLHRPMPPLPRFTLQEDVHSLRRKVYETLDMVVKFRDSLKCETERYLSNLTTDNVEFKNIITQAFNTFATDVTNEVNAFETEMNTTYRIFTETLSADVTGRMETFWKNLAESFTNYSKTLEERTDEAVQNVNANYATFTESINTMYAEMSAELQAKTQQNEATINDAVGYMKTNLHSSIETLLDEDIKAISGNAASLYGVDSSLGDADATDAINAYFAALKAKGQKYAYFDDAHEYTIEGQLTNVVDIIPLGNATFKGKRFSNEYVQPIHALRKTYTGKFNTYGESNKPLARLARALTSKNPVNITIFGDSITTAADDLIGVRYSSYPSVRKFSPDAIGMNNGVFYKIVDEFLHTFRHTYFNFYNRSIGGTNIGQWQSVRSEFGSELAWIDHVKATKPDLVILAFGMNNTTTENTLPTLTALGEIINYIKTTFNPVPSIAILTSPRPSQGLSNANDACGKQQNAVNNSAYIGRRYGSHAGCYIIDVNKAYNIKRSGWATDNPMMKRFVSTGEELNSKTTAASVKAAENTVVINQGQHVEVNAFTDSFTLSFDAAFNGTWGNNSSLMIYNSNRETAAIECLFMICPTGTTNDANDRFAFFAGRRGGVNFSSLYTNQWVRIDEPYADGGVRNFKYVRRHGILEIYVNDKLMHKTNDFCCNDNSNIVISGSGIYDATSSVTLSNLTIDVAEHEQYTPEITDNEMWGNFVQGSYGRKYPYGGNGYNHPSSKGVEAVYVPPIREFVEDVNEACVHQPTVTVEKTLPDVVTPEEPYQTTASGLNIRYRNIMTLKNYAGACVIVDASGTQWTRRDLKSMAECAATLGNNEFAAFTTTQERVLQIVMASSGEIALPLTVYASIYA